jgi:hypothetical protein
MGVRILLVFRMNTSTQELAPQACKIIKDDEGQTQGAKIRHIISAMSIGIASDTSRKLNLDHVQKAHSI